MTKPSLKRFQVCAARMVQGCRAVPETVKLQDRKVQICVRPVCRRDYLAEMLRYIIGSVDKVGKFPKDAVKRQ